MTDSERFDLILAALQDMKTDIQEMKTDMQDMKAEMQDMKMNMRYMKNSVHRLEQIGTTIEVNREDVTNRSIRLIAEGHFDWAQRFEEAIRVREERELLLSRVKVLEDEMRQVKQQLALA